MSYAVTDAGEEDMRAEAAILDELVESIDQLAAQARDCDTLSPQLKRALDVAWYIAETDLRDIGRGSCGHTQITLKPYCSTCSHLQELRAKAMAVRRIL